MSIASNFSIDKFFEKVEVEGRTEIDPLHRSVLDYEWQTLSRIVQISQYHEDREDIISLRTMGDTVYWWTIFLANDIDDPFTDLDANDFLKIPKRSEVFDVAERFRRVE